jgi:prevent-host-death family protein
MTMARDLTPDLQTGVVPISKAASAVAALIKQSKTTNRPIVITQKGSPAAILLSVDLWVELVAELERNGGKL